jgi:hypothetical protein
MRRLLIVAVLALVGMLPISSSYAQAPAQAQTSAKSSDGLYPIVVGLGAIAGVVGFNYFALSPAAAFPFLQGALEPTATSIAPHVSVAMSRVYATTSAVVGAWVANWFYDH